MSRLVGEEEVVVVVVGKGLGVGGEVRERWM
jgi:hypothetical protein